MTLVRFEAFLKDSKMHAGWYQWTRLFCFSLTRGGILPMRGSPMRSAALHLW